MPNQLAKSKRRASLAEHEAVLAALAAIARSEQTTVMDLLCEGARQVIRSRTEDPAMATAIRESICACAPKMPSQFESAAQVARFKRAQREFDSLVQELRVETSDAVQRHNSIVPSLNDIRMPATPNSLF